MSDSKQCKFCNQGYFDCGGPYYFGQDVECVNGVLIDIDEAHEGWQPDVCYPLAPCHPNYETQEPNDSDERLAAWASLGEAAMTDDNVTDIEKRLRNFALNTLALIPDKLQQYPKTDPDLIIKGFSHQCDLLTEAADTIATLRKQLENAREALRGAAYAIEQGNLYETMCCSGHHCGCRGSSHADLALHDINEALKGQPC